jgi:hypothetical protein
MAPEFFPFVLCGLLAIAIVVVASAAVFVQWPRRILERVFPLVLKFLRPLLLLALVPLIALLLVTGLSVRQQFFLNEPMASAAAEGNFARVRLLLDRGASPDSWGVDFVEPALVSAADGGHSDIAQLLLEKGADPSIRDSKGMSALQHARQGGHADVVVLLLKAGARE